MTLIVALATPLLQRKVRRKYKTPSLREGSAAPTGNNTHHGDFSCQEKRETDYLEEDRNSSRVSSSAFSLSNNFVDSFPPPPLFVPVPDPPTVCKQNSTLDNWGLVSYGTTPSLGGHSQSQSMSPINGGNTRPYAHKSRVASDRFPAVTATAYLPIPLSPNASQEGLLRPRGTGRSGEVIPVTRGTSPSVSYSSHRGSDRPNIFVNGGKPTDSSSLSVQGRKPPGNKITKPRQASSTRSGPIPTGSKRNPNQSGTKDVTLVGQIGAPTKKAGGVTSKPTASPPSANPSNVSKRSRLKKKKPNSTTSCPATFLPVLSRSSVSTRTPCDASRPSPTKLTSRFSL